MPHAQSLNSGPDRQGCRVAELSFRQFGLVHHAAVFEPSETWERKTEDGTGAKKDKKEM